MKKSDSPAAKKKTAVAEAGDTDVATAVAAKPKPALGGTLKGGGGPKIYTCYM